MKALTDDEVVARLSSEFAIDPRYSDIWDLRIQLRDMFFNELYYELRMLEHADD